MANHKKYELLPKPEIEQESKNKNDTGFQAKTKDLTDNNHNICQSVLSMLAKGTPYKSTMLRSFFEKLEQRGLFDNFVNHMIHICNSDCAINEVELLLSYALDYVINEAYDRSLFIDVW